jgi:DNA-binding NarL/FixJ family response regulator
MTIRVLIADDHKIVREGLKFLISNSSGMEVVGDAADGRTALAMAKKLKPAVVVMDINMPEMNGIDATSRLMEQLPQAKVIALSMYSSKRFIQSMFKAGASGYLLKDCAFEELLFAIASVSANKKYLSPGLASMLIEDYMGRLDTSESVSVPGLTLREREVLQLIAEGVTTLDISKRLNLSVKTVETHRRRIMEKLEIRSIAGLTKYAIREGVTTID